MSLLGEASSIILLNGMSCTDSLHWNQARMIRKMLVTRKGIKLDNLRMMLIPRFDAHDWGHYQLYPVITHAYEFGSLGSLYSLLKVRW